MSLAGEQLNPNIFSGDGCDQAELLAFVNSPVLSYEHLDWFPSKSRLSEESTFCLYSPEQLEATLSAAPETPDFAWLRFFFTRRDGNHNSNFNLLLDYALTWLKSQGVPRLFSLTTSEWFENLLIATGFEVQNRLISLVTDQLSGTAPQPLPGMIIRPIRMSDLTEICNLDQLCFSPPWQLNRSGLEKCYSLGEYVSLAAIDGKPIAYQVTTRFLDNLHLARLAVHPHFRGRGIAKALLFDLAEHFEDGSIESISVNTQIDNLSSLGLYTSLGFKQEGSLLPVYCLHLI